MTRAEAHADAAATVAHWRERITAQEAARAIGIERARWDAVHGAIVRQVLNDELHETLRAMLASERRAA